MAYGNWGAYVYKNGERQYDFEDNTPYRENELQSGYSQAFLRNSELKTNPHHAVLGETELRLCGYKCYPVLLDQGVDIDLKQFYTGDWDIIGDEKYLPDDYEMEFEYKGHQIKIEVYDNFVELHLEQPNGDVWTSKCGYCYGAGHDD